MYIILSILFLFKKFFLNYHVYFPIIIITHTKFTHIQNYITYTLNLI